MALLSLLLLCAPTFGQSSEPPSRKEQKNLVQEYLQLSRRDADTASRRAAIIQRLDSVILSKKSERKKWRKELEKLERKRPRLEKESGKHWYWPKEKRGLYYVGGELKKPKGLLIGMHGGGTGSGDASGPWNIMKQTAKDLDWVGIFPEVLEKTERGWTDSGTEEWVLQLIEDALRTWKIDPNQVYFSGHSMGGFGTWLLGGHHPDIAAGLAASAGAPTPVYGPDGTILEIDFGVVPNLRNTRMVVFQSLDDPRVPPDANQAAVADIKKAKKRWKGFEKFEYREVDGRGHGYPEEGYGTLLEAIADARRTPLPEYFLWQPSLPWKQQYFWVYWPTPQKNTILECRRNKNTVSFSSLETLDGLEILLQEGLFDLDQEIVIQINGVETNRATATPTLGTLLLTWHGTDKGREFIARIPARIPAQNPTP